MPNASVASFRPVVVDEEWPLGTMLLFAMWVSSGLWLLIAVVARAIWLAVS